MSAVKLTIGYQAVGLYRGGHGTTRYIHHLVMEAFVGLAPEGYQCAHFDGNRANNRLDNLRWARPVDNSADKERHGTRQFAHGTPTAKLSWDIVDEIRKSPLNNTQAAKKFGISAGQISAIRNGKAWVEQ